MAGEVAVSLIVREDEDDVRLPAGERCGEESERGAEEEKKSKQHGLRDEGSIIDGV
jgi:hypothetical protein